MATDPELAGRLWHLQERLKHEYLFVTKEKEAIANLNAEILCTCEKLFHVSWTTRQQWKLGHRVRASPEKCSHASNLLDRARFVDANKFLGHLESRYGEFLRSLRENPRVLASCLVYTDQLNIDTTQVIRLLLNSLYGNCILPEDESYALLLMKYLIDIHISVGDNLEGFFQHHRNSFTTIFSVLVESLFSAKLYLTAALHAPIMQVLTEDSLLQAKLPFVCNKFVKSLESKLYCFPPSLSWLVSQFHNLLLSSGQAEASVARSMVLKLLFDFLVCPAIIRPEQFGITSDVQISDIALKNLQQIASCLLCSSTERENPRAADVFSRVDLDCFTSFLDSILQGHKDLPNCPNPESPPGLCRSSVLITENDLRALICFLRMIEHGEEHRDIIDQEVVRVLLDHLPKGHLSNASKKPNHHPPIPSSPNMSVTNSPKPRSKHRLQKIMNKRSHKSSTTEATNLDTNGREEKSLTTQVDEGALPMSVFEECKSELMKRLLAFIEEEEEVMVISLGYPSIECPGMQPEEKILGLKSGAKQETHPPVMRQRSSSSKFSHNILSKSIEEVAKEKLHSSGSVLVDLEESSQMLDDSSLLSFGSVEELDHSSQTDPFTLSQTGQQPDLLGPKMPSLISDNPFSGIQTELNDNLGNSPRNQQEKPANRSGADLIDLLSDSPPENHLTLLEISKTQENGVRDSSCSTGSSARDSTLSNCSSTAEMGRESYLDGSFDFEGIPEEQDATGLNFRKRTSHVLRSNETAGSEALAANDNSPFPDSQASFDSTAAEVGTAPSVSSSSSAQEEEPDTPQAIQGLKKKRNSLKGKILRKTKSFGIADKLNTDKDLRRFRSVSQTDANSENTEKKGTLFFGRIKKGKRRGGRQTKLSGTRVYSKLAEDSFSISQSIPHPTVEDKTPKDIIEEIMKKYMVMSGQPEASEDVEDTLDSDDEDEGDAFDEEDKFKDAKRKLRLVLCRADFQRLPWLLSEGKQRRQRVAECDNETQELLTFLHVQLAEAINLQDRSLAAQLHETSRTVRELPKGRCTKLLDSLEEEYKERSPYLAYLIRSRQGLLATQAHMESIMDKVDRDKAICSKFFTMTCVNLFLEEKVKEINSFANRFQNLPTSDEKRELMDEFLKSLENEVVRHPVWLGANEEQHMDVFMAIERAIMSRIFKFAFYPNGEIDMERDRTFLEHVKELQKVVTMNHKAVRIPKVYRKEAPWDSAQKELLNINAYKTPTDKLKCVQRCCSTIMNLLSMASEASVPGADDFFPVMVYVVIHANPPSLLSTMQYISNFYSDRLGGEEAYCWMQYCGAIEFIKTLRSSEN